MWRPLLFSFLLFSLFIPLFSISLSDETFGEESNKLHLGLTLENQSFTLGGTVNVSASLPQKGNISFEIVDPLGRVKYLKTLETDEKGKVNLLFSVPPSWLPGSYTLSATAGNKGNVLNNTIQFEIKENLYLKPDLSLKSHDILIIYPGEELNFSKSKEVETLLLRDDKEKMLVYVRIWNTGDGMGVAKIKIFLRSGNNKHFLAEINISIEATSYEILSFEMDGTSIPEDCEYFFLFVSIEDTTPRDKNPFNNKVVKKFEISRTSEDEKKKWWLQPDAPAIALAIFSTTLFFAVLQTEVGRYKFFSLFLPLYTRLKKKELENQETRGLILGYITAKPGACYREIQRALKIANGTFDYHIKVLLKGKKIKKRNNGTKVMFFPYSFTIGEFHLYTELTKREKRYLLWIRDHDLITIKELAKNFSVSKQNIYPVINSLKEKGFIFYREDGRLARQPITLTDKGREIVEKIKQAL